MLPFPEVESSPPSMPYPLDVPSGQKAFGSLRPCRKIGRVPPGKPYFPEKHCRPAHRARTIFAVDGGTTSYREKKGNNLVWRGPPCGSCPVRQESTLGGAFAISAKGQTCVPVKIFWKGTLVKLELALARGKKNYDKKASKKIADINRDKERALKNFK